MNNRDEKDGDEKDWRKLCELVATENDPERLSELVDKLLKELDSRRQALRVTDK